MQDKSKKESNLLSLFIPLHAEDVMEEKEEESNNNGDNDKSFFFFIYVVGILLIVMKHFCGLTSMDQNIKGEHQQQQ